MKPLYTFLVTLCVVCLVGILILAYALYESYAKLQFARVFPLGYVAKEANDPGRPTVLPTITFWGDSRADSWSKHWVDETYASLDFAHGAQTSSQLRLQLNTLPLGHTDYSLVQIGINDLHPIGVLSPREPEIVAQLEQNIAAILQALLERSDVVVVTTIFPPRRVPLVRRLVWARETTRYIAQVNNLIRAAADGERVVLLDAHAILSNQDSYLNETYADDDFFLHVNGSAYTSLNERLREILIELRTPGSDKVPLQGKNVLLEQIPAGDSKQPRDQE